MRIVFYLFLSLAMMTVLGCKQAGEDMVTDVASLPAATEDTPFTRATDVAVSPTLTLEATATPQPYQPRLPESVTDVTANYGYTHQQADGNRLVSGQGALPDATVIDVPLLGRPVWIVGAPIPTDANDQFAGARDASGWAVVMDDGRVQAFIVNGERVEETSIEPSQVQGIPPLLKVTGDNFELLLPPAPAYGSAPPAIIDEQGRMATVSPDGTINILDSDGAVLTTAENPPLPDGRLLVDEDGRLLYLSVPTTRYAHGIAGDEIEAASVTLLDPSSENSPETIITVPEPSVIEGIMPLWADLDGDGEREIIVTQSDAEKGAQIVVYDESGQQVAQGPAIGLGNRWRHQLAVAPFGPQGEIELVDVLTPHIGGVVEFYQLLGKELHVVATIPGYTSHVIGSRNLDMALAGDLDGDGHVELLLPDQSLTHLGGIRRTARGAEVAWVVPLAGKLSTNLVAVQLPGGGVMFGAGQEDGTLRLWLPERSN